MVDQSPATGGNGSGAPAHPLGLTEPQLRALSVLLDRQLFMRMAGQQFDGRRDLYAIFGYDRVITSRQYREEYARGGIAQRIVDAFPRATWRGGVELYEDEDPEHDTPFETAWRALERKHHIWSTLQDVDTLAGLSTYAVLLIGAPGALDAELPRGTPDSLLYLTPFWGGGGPGDAARDSSMRAQSTDTDVTIERFDVDPASPRFGEPLAYRIRRTDVSSPLLAREVHWTRVVHVCEKSLDSRVYGTPTLESVWNLLFDLEKVTGGGAESFFQRAKHSLHVNASGDSTIDPASVQRLKDKLDEYAHGMTNVIPTRGVDLKLLEAAVANFSAPADAILKQIAGAKGIPYRILTGSEMGTLASEQDAANFDSQVQDRRTGYAGPMIVRRLVDRLIEYGYLPTPRQYDVRWPVTENMDDKGKADVAGAMADVNVKYAGVVFTDAEIRERSFDLQPLPEQDSSEELSESQKADIAAKLTLANKQMGLTVFTDDEIRKITYGFGPLPDSEKVPIGAPERISVTEPPHIGEPDAPAPQLGEPPQPSKAPPAAALRAAEDRALLRALETAIRKGDRRTVDGILGLQAHRYGTTQVQLPPDVAEKLLAFGRSVPDADVAEEAGGRETDAHVTVRYGLTAPDADALRDVPVSLSGGRPTTVGKAQAVSLTLGRTAFFSADDYDVVYVDVRSEDLAALHRAIGKSLPVAPPTHDAYLPHATVAYVKPGRGARYAGWAGLDGVVVAVSSITLCDADGNRTEVPLS